MSVVNNDYNPEDVISFLKEEFERIITQYPRQRGGSILSDAQALAIWFLHQEAGIPYEEANQYVLDDSNDCGVDFIWVDKENHQLLVGQIEYDTSVWSKNTANQDKAIKTFENFKEYLNSANLPEKLHESAKALWREARKLYICEDDSKYEIRFIFVTPKHFSDIQEEKIREKSEILNYEFFTYNTLIERGQEFLDGQTGMGTFKIHFQNEPLKISSNFGCMYVANISLKEIHRIVEVHEKNKKLAALFASNVRSYLNTKKRSKEIAEAMRNTIKNEPDHFLLCNNGITIQCSKVTPSKDHLLLERASISNGCQTVMNIDRFFKENEGANPDAEVLVTVIELHKNAPLIAGEIARSRNYQNPVDNRDLMSNHPLLVTLHHRLFADKLHGSEKKYYLVRKQGEKQTLLKEEPNAKGKFMWIDADYLARCISAILRQDPYISQQGTNDIFGKYFKKIFPAVHDPSHSRCKYAYWLVSMVDESYNSKSKWKGVDDRLINQQRDFKSPAKWIVASLIASQLKEHFSFNEGQEKRFIEKCEKWSYTRNPKELKEFEEITFKMMDNCFRLLHAISKRLLGKKLPKARDPYLTYENLFKGPNYEYLMLKVRKNDMKTYQDTFRKSMSNFVEYLRDN
ncbi:MAG: AIPR family protein [Nanobdellota archaeon]